MVRNLIRSAFRRIGFDIRRYSPAATYEAQFAAMLARHKIDLILDVGANTGQFAKALRNRIGYRGRIVSFEPLAAAHGALIKAAARDPNWEIAPRAAIGAAAGSVVLNVSGNSVSSSVLPMLNLHETAAPESRYVREETVPLVTLDAAAIPYMVKQSRVFLKIDTQGYEAEVLRGATQVISKSTGLQLELSIVPLYEGQALIMDSWQSISREGFDLWAMTPAFIDPASGRLLQVDATYFRNKD